MDWRRFSWPIAVIGIIVNCFGFLNFLAFIVVVVAFCLGGLCLLFLRQDSMQTLMSNDEIDNPLNVHETLGLKLHKRRKNQLETGPSKVISTGVEVITDDEYIDTTQIPVYNLCQDSPQLDEHGSPIKKQKRILSGHKQMDKIIHTMIDYIIRDYIESWFCSLSDNKEFSEFRTRSSIEECLQNICKRVKNIQWVPILTTRLVDIVANHTKLYRLANQSINANTKESKQRVVEKISPQKRASNGKQSGSNGSLHRRNKSDTDVKWNMSDTTLPPKNVANSKFYTNPLDEESLLDPEMKLFQAFFNNCDTYKEECLNERSLETYLTRVMETMLYFTLPAEDFACTPLRTFLATLVANVVLKPVVDMLSDPDFLNLQLARLVSKEPPPSEYFIKMVRQSSDLSELRACRQLITREMDKRFKESSNADLSSLKYIQKLIDLRISHLQKTKSNDFKDNRDKATASNLPILTLDEILNKELALSYYLDYLSVLNLQKYVLFYLTAQEWRRTVVKCIDDLQSSKSKNTREEIAIIMREKAANIYHEYLMGGTANSLIVDSGLVEVLNIKLRETSTIPDPSWMDSICKYVYEKLKNEDIFLNNFYQSSAYKKLLLELEFLGQATEPMELDLHLGPGIAPLIIDTSAGGDSNSGDLCFDDDDNDENMEITTEHTGRVEISTGPVRKKQTETSYDLSSLPFIKKPTEDMLLDVGNHRHARSHSDCTGINQSITEVDGNLFSSSNKAENNIKLETEATVTGPTTSLTVPGEVGLAAGSSVGDGHHQPRYRLMAKIINAAIHSEGNYAVYAIHIMSIEDNQQKSWHVYRRYSKLLELKKTLAKRFPYLPKLPFPAKKAFHNTDRQVLEHRMIVLNEFLRVICMRAEENIDIRLILNDFLEPDNYDGGIHGGAVIRTIETIVNPLKSGMRTIKNMPDTLVGGISKIFLGKGREQPFFSDTATIQLEQSSEYPALTSMLNLVDEVFDLQSRSQWLRRGIINRVLGAPWVSHAANKKLINAAKALIEQDKLEQLLNNIMNSIWPDGKRQTKHVPREDNTKLRTRMAAKIALFALLSDDLKHWVGSETTRSGLLDFFGMWQHKKLNVRLVLVILNEILTKVFDIKSLVKHTEGFS